MVSRWVNEVQEAVSSPNDMVQFHALSLLYEIKKNDRLAISKMVTQLTKVSARLACTQTPNHPTTQPPNRPTTQPPTHPSTYSFLSHTYNA